MLQSELEKKMTTQAHQTAYVQRCRFAREGATTYLGHLDLMTVFERAARRAELPILYSQGYNPRPMMVFALPLGVGIESTCDYLDISLECPYDAGDFAKEMNAALPEGLRILSAKSIPEPKDSIMSLVTTASYRFEAKGIRPALLKAMEKDALIVTKMAKGKAKDTDIRPLLLAVKSEQDEAADVVEIITLAGSANNARPDLILQSLKQYCGLDAEIAENARVVRTGLYAGNYPNTTPIEDCPVRSWSDS